MGLILCKRTGGSWRGRTRTQAFTLLGRPDWTIGIQSMQAIAVPLVPPRRPPCRVTGYEPCLVSVSSCLIGTELFLFAPFADLWGDTPLGPPSSFIFLQSYHVTIGGKEVIWSLIPL